MDFLLARIDETTARRKIEARKFRRLRRLLASPLHALIALYDVLSLGHQPARRPRRPLPHIETVWLPYYHVQFDIARNGVTSTAHTLVGGHNDLCMILDPRDLQRTDQPDATTFPPTFGRDEAVDYARQTLMTLAMKSPGWSARASVGKVREVRLLHYPYWVYYYERRKNRLDFKVLDAVTGKLPGPKVKDALITAFVRAEKESSHGSNVSSA